MGVAPEVIFNVGSFGVTNTILNTIAVDALIIGGVIYYNKTKKNTPGMFQNIIEMIIDSFYKLTQTVAGKHSNVIFPIFMSFFIFILIANWSGLIPGVNAIGINEGHGEDQHLIPFLRNATSDLNLTIALALVSFFATHLFSIKAVGIKDYIGRYISLNPINLFVGLLDIISEFTKIISLSFRLFGNIYAGEVILVIMGSIFAFVFPVPFLMLEILVGFIQAIVFSMLTLVFMATLMTPHKQGAH